MVSSLLSVSKKVCRGGASTRPQILPKQNLSPQGEKSDYFPSENPKNFVLWRAGHCPAPTEEPLSEVF